MKTFHPRLALTDESVVQVGTLQNENLETFRLLLSVGQILDFGDIQQLFMYN